MRTIALYNRQGQRLLTLREAEQKGHGSAYMLRKRITRGHLPAYNVSYLWLVPKDALPRPVRRLPPRKNRRRGSH